MLARYAAEKNQNLFHEIRPSFLCRAVEPACAKGGAAFLKPLYDSIIQRYAQLEKVPESALRYPKKKGNQSRFNRRILPDGITAGKTVKDQDII